MTNVPPNDVRNFVHKRLFSAAKGFVTSGFNPLSAVGGFLAPTTSVRASSAQRAAQNQAAIMRRRLPRPVSRAVTRLPTSRTLTARPDASSAAEKQAGRAVKFPMSNMPVSRFNLFGGDCLIPGQRIDPRTGECSFFLGDQSGRDDQPIGDTVMGRHGAGEVPGNMVIDRAICRRGMVLGDDGVCYNRSQISNKERAWPRGRRPLLTGGDMRAISTAARAGKRLEGATKRLQKIGLMKKPASRRSIAARHHAT